MDETKSLAEKTIDFYQTPLDITRGNPSLNIMKYIVNENNTCGQASLTDDLRNTVLESMGYTPKKEEASEQITESVTPQAEVEESSDMPTLYEWDGSVFALDDEVFEIEGDLFLKAIELDSETRMGLDESHKDLFINEVRFEESPFSLGDIYDFGKEIFIKLDEAKEELSAADKLKAFKKNQAGENDTPSARAKGVERETELKNRTKAQKSDNAADTKKAEADAARDAANG